MKRCLLLLVLCFVLLPFVGSGQIITNFAGGGSFLGDGGFATNAAVPQPAGGVFDKYGNYYFLHSLSSPRVRMIDTNGVIHTVAGNGSVGFSGDGGPATAATLNPQGIGIDTIGNIYIADFYNYRIRKVNAVTHIITTIAGIGTAGCTGSGGPATAAKVMPGGLCVDRIGNIYVVDSGGGKVRKIDTSGIITSIAGNGTYGFSGDGGPATAAALAINNSICIDTFGNVFLAADKRIRKINTNTGLITTIAGNGNWYYIGDGMHADSAQFEAYAIGIDKIDNIYIADYSNDRVYQVDTSRVFHLIAGNGSTTYSGDGGPATAASLYNPEGVTADACGNVYIADESNNHIRRVWLSGVAATTAVTVAITASADTTCVGSAITYTATIAGGGSVNTYYWYVNDTLVSVGASNVFTDTLAASDSVYCMLNSHNHCAMPAMARSNTIHSVVLPRVTPSITIAPNPNDTVCGVNAVLFTATIANGGSSPAYQWYLNGSVAGAGGSTYSYAPANGDSVRCVLTSNAFCALPAIVSSNTLNMVVAPLVHPTVTLSGSTVVPVGSSVTVSAAVTGGGSSYSLRWLNHGFAFATTSVRSVTYAKTVGTDTITARVLSNDLCIDSAVLGLHIVWDHDVSVGSLQSAIGSLRIYPNPVNSVLYVECETAMQSVVITNILGQAVIKSESGERRAVVPVGQLAAGVYILEVVGEDGGIYREKIVRE